MTKSPSFFVRRESALDHVTVEDNTADDFDLVQSPKDGSLVVVMQRHGVAVCWQCVTQFVEDKPGSPLRPVEMNCGGYGTRILIHAQCVKRGGPADAKVIWDAVQAHQAKRERTRLTKPFRQ